MISMKGVGFPTDLVCPECNAHLHIKFGKNGLFLACSGYPKCTFTRNYTRNDKGKIVPVETASEEISDINCSKCNKPMLVKQGRYGTFLACSGYPACKNTQSLNANGVSCPEKGCDGDLVERKSKRGKIFYGCNRYPDCTFATWDKPIAKECPACHAEFVVEKSTKKAGTFLTCMNPGCGFKEVR